MSFHAHDSDARAVCNGCPGWTEIDDPCIIGQFEVAERIVEPPSVENWTGILKPRLNGKTRDSSTRAGVRNLSSKARSYSMT